MRDINSMDQAPVSKEPSIQPLPLWIAQVTSRVGRTTPTREASYICRRGAFSRSVLDVGLIPDAIDIGAAVLVVSTERSSTLLMRDYRRVGSAIVGGRDLRPATLSFFGQFLTPSTWDRLVADVLRDGRPARRIMLIDAVERIPNWLESEVSKWIATAGTTAPIWIHAPTDAVAPRTLALFPLVIAPFPPPVDEEVLKTVRRLDPRDEPLVPDSTLLGLSDESSISRWLLLKHTSGDGGGGEHNSHHSRRALILTAIDEEYSALRRRISKRCAFDRQPTHHHFEEGTVQSAGGAWEVLIGKTGRGNLQSQSMTSEAVRIFSPEIAIFLGVAGGRADRGVKLNDVIVATHIYGYEQASVSASALRSKPEFGSVDPAMVQIARRVAAMGRVRSSMTVLEGPIASGEKVVRGRNVRESRLAFERFSDALAFETEGLGFAKAAAGARVPSMVLRGISDLLGNKTLTDAAGYQRSAANNAASFAIRIIKEISLRVPVLKAS